MWKHAEIAFVIIILICYHARALAFVSFRHDCFSLLTVIQTVRIGPYVNLSTVEIIELPRSSDPSFYSIKKETFH